MLGSAGVAAIKGTDAFESTLFMVNTVMLQPATYVRGLANGLAASVCLFERCPVEALERTGASWLLRTPKGG